jgi:hypothetical protein
MPLAQYFLLVGGTLLVMLLVAGAYLPSLPAVDRAEAHRTAIRIHSDLKLPERVVFDTSMPAITRSGAVVDEARMPAPPSADAVSANARQAFAQLQSSDASKVKITEPKRQELKPVTPSRKGEARKRTGVPRKVRLARQPQFDWFGGRMWW